MKNTKKIFLISFFILNFPLSTLGMQKFLKKLPLKYFSTTFCPLTNFVEKLFEEKESEEKKLLLFFGPPGSGKGSVGKELAKLPCCKVIDTGKWLRESVPKEKKITEQIRNGQLLDDSFISDWATEKTLNTLSDDKNKIVILDGFPRTILQAHNFLNWFCKNQNPDFFSIIQFHASIQFIEKYALNRASCPQCKRQFIPVEGSPYLPKNPGLCDDCDIPLQKRCDDTPETVANRIEQYESETAASIDILNESPYAEKFKLHMCCTKNNPLGRQFESFKEIISIENGEL